MTRLTRNIQSKLAVAVLLLLAVVCLGMLPAMAQSAQQSSAILDKVNKIPGLGNIKHVVFLFKENRSFDNMFSHWNDAGSARTPVNTVSSGPISTGQILALQDMPDAVSHDICHGWGCFILAIDNGKMDGFDLQIVGSPCSLNGDYECYGRQTAAQMKPYFTYAEQFGLGDNYFTSIKTATTPNHLYSVAAQSGGVITNAPDGCDSPPNDVLAVLDPNGNLSTQFPCVDMLTLMDELQSAGVSWRYYADTKIPFNAMQLISHLRFGPLWVNNVSDANFVNDVNSGNLQQVSWLMATGEATDHPPYSLCFGENYTITAINAIMNSKYWSTEPTAIFVAWDDSGGWYEHVAPPILDQYGVGARSPFIVISPYTPDTGGAGSVSHVQYEHSSVLRFVEDLFTLPNMTNRDAGSNQLAADPALFDFNQALRGPVTQSLQQCVPNSTNQLQFFQTQQVGTPSPVQTVTLRNFSMSTKLSFSSITISGDPEFTQTNTCANGVQPLRNESPTNCTVNVTFTPTSAGTKNATLTLMDNDVSSPQTVALTATGTNLALNPALLTFGTQQVFSGGPGQMATFTNSGSVPVTISNIVASGDYSQTNNCGSGLNPGASCTITAVFLPTMTGTRFGTVTISSSDGGSPHILGLTGMGTQVSLTPATLSFSSQAIGSVSPSQPVTLTNMGSTALTIANPTPSLPPIMLTGNNGGQPDSFTKDFQQLNSCPSSLGPGASCTINVSFTPVVQGALMAQLFVWDSEGDSPQVVNITGTGAASTNNPIPLEAQSLSPRSAAPGSASVLMTVNGAGFGTKSVVNWNGATLATTFVSGHRLDATIPASDLASAGTASITVSTAGPGGGTSNVQFFQVATSTAAVSFNRADITTGRGPKDVISADFNKDGKQDLVVLNNTDSTASIFMGNGDGTFALVGTMCTGGSTNSVCNAVNPVAAAVGDMNNDGDLDLIVANNSGNTLSILLGNGALSFTQGALVTAIWPSDVQVADFNRDGNLDLAYPYSIGPAIGVWLGNGDGTFIAATTPPNTGAGPIAMALGDFNLDNKVDIAIADSTDNNVTVLLGQGDGSFKNSGAKPNTGHAPVAIASGDFNGDGKPDLVTANQTDGTVSVLLGTGTGTFTNGGTFPTGAMPDSIALGDFNADNKLDVAVGNAGSGTVSVLLGNGTGTLQGHQDSSVGSAPAGLATGDFNRDGTLDLVVANLSSNNASVLLGSGGSNGGPSVSVTPSSLAFGVVPVGTISTGQPVTISNTGTVLVNISSITITGAFLKNSQCSATLAPGQKCTVLVAFKPVALGQATGSLTITDNAVGSPQTVTLSGTGTALGPNPPSLNFQPQTVGTSSQPQTITITNVAPTGNLKITKISITGTNVNDFGQTNNCPASLPPGANCAVNVTFTPSATGNRSANVQFIDNGGGSPQLVPLTGVGQ
jgi:phospholipase C